MVRVDLANFNPARGRIALNLTANGSLVAQRTVTLGIDERQTVYLRAVPRLPAKYDLRLNGDSVGTVTVTEASESRTPTAEGSTGTSAETSSSTDTPTPGSTSTAWRTSAESGGTESPSSVGTGATTPSVGPDSPTGTETVVAAGMSLMLLYGVGVAVYVLREHPPDGFD